MRRLILATALVLTAAVLAGCGNKGPLYLPRSQPVPAPAPAASGAPAPAGSTASGTRH